MIQVVLSMFGLSGTKSPSSLALKFHSKRPSLPSLHIPETSTSPLITSVQQSLTPQTKIFFPSPPETPNSPKSQSSFPTTTDRTERSPNASSNITISNSGSSSSSSTSSSNATSSSYKTCSRLSTSSCSSLGNSSSNKSPKSPMGSSRFHYLHMLSDDVVDGQFMRKITTVGSGYAGTVHKCRMTYGSSRKSVTVAVKVMLKERTKSRAAEKEFALLKLAEGPNVIQLLTACECRDAYVLVTEFCDKGDLHGLLGDLGDNYVLTRKYMTDVVNGLKWIHDRLIAHCDVKMKNIVITDRNVAKLADLGFAGQFESKKSLTDVCAGTKDYWAPEMLLSQPLYSPFKSDIYALGVTFVGVCERKPIKRRHDCINDIVEGWKDLEKKALFQGLLKEKSEERWEFVQILASSWLSYEECLTPPISPV